MLIFNISFLLCHNELKRADKFWIDCLNIFNPVKYIISKMNILNAPEAM